MAKNELKTKKNTKSVTSFLDTINDPERKRDAKKVLAIMKRATGQKPVMWGSSIVGFGEYDYVYASGRSGTWMVTGFSPRKQALSIYIMPGYTFPAYTKLLAKLGPHKTGKSCLYIKHLEDIHLPTLEKIIEQGYKDMVKKYPEKKK